MGFLEGQALGQGCLGAQFRRVGGLQTQTGLLQYGLELFRAGTGGGGQERGV